MLSYTLPDFTVGLDRNLAFVALQRECPEMFQEGVRIDSVYGCFPSCALNGGRAFVREPYTSAQIERTFEILEERGVKARLTLTNMLITPDDLNDPYANAILESAARHRAEIIVYSDVLDCYLRENFDFKRVLSTTRKIEDSGTLNDALRSFDYVVLNYNKNKDYDFIRAIEHPERVEVMVNELCHPGCPFRQQHYLHNSEDQKNGAVTSFRACDVSDSAFFAHSPESPTIYTTDEVRRLRDDFGIRFFKIVGRGVARDVTLESCLYYLIKPEYRQMIRNLI